MPYLQGDYRPLNGGAYALICATIIWGLVCILWQGLLPPFCIHLSPLFRGASAQNHVTITGGLEGAYTPLMGGFRAKTLNNYRGLTGKSYV